MKKTQKKGFFKQCEDIFAAAGLAEGDPVMAKDYLASRTSFQSGSELQHLIISKAKDMIRLWEETFAAAALAEGSQDMARNYLKMPARQPDRQSLHDFLETVGLSGIRVQYRIAVV